MDEDFIRGRAQDIRELAAKADPFTQKRLLDLADTYERRLHPCRTPRQDAQADMRSRR